jgi:hypothetical protein
VRSLNAAKGKQTAQTVPETATTLILGVSFTQARHIVKLFLTMCQEAGLRVTQIYWLILKAHSKLIVMRVELSIRSRSVTSEIQAAASRTHLVRLLLILHPGGAASFLSHMLAFLVKLFAHFVLYSRCVAFSAVRRCPVLILPVAFPALSPRVVLMLITSIVELVVVLMIIRVFFGVVFTLALFLFAILVIILIRLFFRHRVLVMEMVVA